MNALGAEVRTDIGGHTVLHLDGKKVWSGNTVVAIGWNPLRLLPQRAQRLRERPDLAVATLSFLLETYMDERFTALSRSLICYQILINYKFM